MSGFDHVDSVHIPVSVQAYCVIRVSGAGRDKHPVRGGVDPHPRIVRKERRERRLPVHQPPQILYGEVFIFHHAPLIRLAASILGLMRPPGRKMDMEPCHDGVSTRAWGRPVTTASIELPLPPGSIPARTGRTLP